MSSVVLWDFPFPWHCVTPIRRLRIWQAIGPHAVTDKKKSSLAVFLSVWYYSEKWGSKTETSQENYNDEIGRTLTRGGKGAGGQKGEKRGGTELKLKGSEEQLMSGLQREIFCRQPSLDCQLTKLPTQTSLKKSDKSADMPLEYQETWEINGTFPPAGKTNVCVFLQSSHRLTRHSLTLLNHYNVFYII